MESICLRYYKSNIEPNLKESLSLKEKELCLKVFKSISFSIWSNDEMPIELKNKYFESLCYSNVLDMLHNLICSINEHSIEDEMLIRDLSSLPHEWLFHNQVISVPSENSIKHFNTINVYSTGDIKIGSQVGEVSEDGKAIIDSHVKSEFDKYSCYFLLSFLEAKDLETNFIKKHVFFDYFLGNDLVE